MNHENAETIENTITKLKLSGEAFIDLSLCLSIIPQSNGKFFGLRNLSKFSVYRLESD